MPHTANRLRQLLEELQRAQHESGDVASQARQDLAGAISGSDLRPVGAARSQRKKKAGKKKR